jgi:hypothetical protein
VTIAEPVKDHELAGYYGLECWCCVVTDGEKLRNFYGKTAAEAERRARAYIIEPDHADWRDLHHERRKKL